MSDSQVALLLFSSLLVIITEASVYEQHQCLSNSEIVPGLNAELATRAAQDRFSGAVLISRQGKALFRNVYEELNRERSIPNAPNTRFRFGSLGKMFTGVAIMQLVQAGAVQLDDLISVYLPGYPNPDVANATIHQLLTHTGGTGDIYGPAFQEHRLELKELSDYVALYGMRGTLFPPGSRHEYSNYGYILLGRVIEEVSGLTYEEYVRRNIFQPAGMRSTGTRRNPNTSHDWRCRTHSLRRRALHLILRACCGPRSIFYLTVEIPRGVDIPPCKTSNGLWKH